MSTALLTVERDGNVAHVHMDDGRGNALSTAMLKALERAAMEAEAADAVLLTGRARVFCGGLDLNEVIPMNRDALHAFLEQFHRTFALWHALPRPVVVAVAGGAVAGGAIMMFCGDMRLGADDSGLVGVNEARLGIPFPAIALEIVRSALDPQQAARALLFGDLLPKRGAMGRGYFHELAASDQLLARATELAKQASAVPGTASAAIKGALRREAVQRAEADRERSHRVFMDAWMGPLAQERLKAVLAGIARKQG